MRLYERVDMKILFITRAYGEHAGGMERLSYEFIQAAGQHPHIETTVLANKTNKGTSLAGTRRASALFALSVIPRALSAARGADIVHIGDPVLSLAGWFIKIFIDKPVVVTVHGLDITHASMLYQLYLALFFRAFDLYLPISTHVASLLQLKHVNGHIEVLTPGVTDRYYDKSISRSELAEQLSLSKDNIDNIKVLLTVGRLVPRKGHAWFIQNVLPKLPENVLYVIAGTGPADASIQRAIEDAKQAGRVQLLDRVSDADLKTLYNTVDLFVQPNIPTNADSEGFGLVLLEAALCNRPVLASKIEGITDAIHDGKNGTLVPAGDVNAWVSAVKQVLAELQINKPRQFTLRTFNWQQIMEAYYSLLAPVGK